MSRGQNLSEFLNQINNDKDCEVGFLYLVWIRQTINWVTVILSLRADVWRPVFRPSHPGYIQSHCSVWIWWTPTNLSANTMNLLVVSIVLSPAGHRMCADSTPWAWHTPGSLLHTLNTTQRTQNECDDVQSLAGPGDLNLTPTTCGSCCRGVNMWRGEVTCIMVSHVQEGFTWVNTEPSSVWLVPCHLEKTLHDILHPQLSLNTCVTVCSFPTVIDFCSFSVKAVFLLRSIPINWETLRCYGLCLRNSVVKTVEYFLPIYSSHTLTSICDALQIKKKWWCVN